MAKNSEILNPPKGMRDFQPNIQILRKKIFEKIENIFQTYGFDPIETPIVERWEVLKGKYGEEAENRLIWRFKLPYTKKEFGLRYDLTVPLARFIAKFKPKMPFKRYHIGRVFRYEEPQKGRYREFWQCDIDIVGTSSELADAEILNIIIDILEEFGFKDYIIKLNDRRLLSAIFEKYLKIKDYDTLLKIYRIIDKIDKIGMKKVFEEIKAIKIDKKVFEEIRNLIEFSRSKENILDFLAKYKLKEIDAIIKSLNKILEYVKKSKRVKIDLSLVRGLDYYTGMIYEAIVEKPKIGSLSGGGRYDNLIGIFLGKKIPAVGGSIGVERLIDAGIDLGIFDLEEKTYSKVGIVYTKDVDQKLIFEIANEMRKNGIKVFLPFESYRSIIEGIKDLDKRGINYGLIIGRKEIEEKKLTLQNLKTRERFKVEVKDIVKLIS